MLDSLSEIMKCEICGGRIEIDNSTIVDDYAMTMSTDISNISNTVDRFIGKYLIYKCVECGNIYKYTYKDIEKFLRKHVTKKLLMLIVKGEMTTASVLDPYFIYCGKCTGFDGTGSCPHTIFEKCKIKEFPYNGI